MNYPLYGGTPPHVAGSDTSEAAAVAIQPSAEKLRAKALSFIKAHEGATCDEVEISTGMIHQTASARIRELVLKGLAKDSGARRETRSGRSATVWVAT